MKLKRKTIFKRLLCMVLSIAMIMQIEIPAQSAYAAEETAVELLTNGDFSDVNPTANTAANWEFRTEGATTYAVEEGSVTYHINVIGTADWVNYMKYTPAVSFTSGNEYTITMELTSSADRTILYGFDNGRMYMAQEKLTAGEKTTVTNTFTASATGTNNFMLYLGLVDEADADLVHDVTISSVSITEKGASGSTGDDTAVTSGTKVPYTGSTNGFAGSANLALGKTTVMSGAENDASKSSNAVDNNEGTRWASNFDDTAWMYVDLGEVYSISQVKLIWEASYGTAYDIQVSADGENWKTVAEMRNQDGGTDIVNFAAEDARYVKMQGVTRALPYGYSIYEFQVYETAQDETEQPTQESTEEEPTQPPTPDDSSDSALTADFIQKDAEAKTAEGNLIVNGNFNAPAGDLSNWNLYNTYASFYTAESDNRVVMEITNYGADWQQGLMQQVTMEAGTTYNISFDAETTGTDVNIAAGMDPARDYTTAISAADGVVTVSYEYTPDTSGTKSFFLFLGNNSNCGIAISNVSITVKPIEFNDAAENDTVSDAYTPITTLEGTVPEDYSILKDGNFTNGLSFWETWCESWMSQYNVVQYTQLEKGMNVWITNTGGGEGNYPWDAQLNQPVTFKANTHYVFKGTVSTEKARAINLAFNNASTGDNYRTVTIGMQAGESRDMYFELPVFTEDTEVLFSIQMGNVAGDVQQNNMVFKDLLIEVNGYTDLAEAVTAEDADEFVLSGVASADDYMINPAGTNGTIRVNNVSLASNSAYELSFVAGTRGNAGQVTATVYNSNGTAVASDSFSLLHSADIKSLSFDNAAADENAYVVFEFTGCDGESYIDSIALYAEGYASAMGINTEVHDITPLIPQDAPVISEGLVTENGSSRYPEIGEDVVLTYTPNTSYQNAVQKVTVNGKEVSYTLGNGTITIPGSAFNVAAGAVYEEFDIVVTADWFTDAVVFQNVYRDTDWVMTWSDEFSGTEVDLSKWSYQNGTGVEYGVAGWGNNEQQYYTDENIEVKDGKLVITATEGTHGMPYDSGRIWTMNDDQTTSKFSQTYGRFEAKMSLPTGNGIWPAFWMLPVDSSIYGGWPLSGEIDIMEARGRLPETVCGTLHYGQTWPNNVYSGGDYYFDEGEDFSTYHVYALEWEPGEIRWYVDGELYLTQNSWYSTSSDQPDSYSYPAPFNQEFYIILNLAVGGTFDGNRNPNASDLPAEMCVDYVRVFSSTAEYDEFVEKPAIDPVEVPEGVKDSIEADNFANINIMNEDTDAASDTAWNLVTLPSYGGAASFSTSKDGADTVGKIGISNGGSQSYSVQMINMVSLYKGHYYKLSFDAKADAARTLIAKIGDDGNPSWDTFHSAEVELGNGWNHYEIVFQMPRTEETARVELNMGLDTASVYLKNVSLAECEAADAENDPDCEKEVSMSDNHVYNGIFNVGSTERLDFWHTVGDVTVIRDEEYDFICQLTGDAEISQTGIKLSQSDTYRLVFDAKALGSTTATVTLGGVSKNVTLTEGMDTYTVEFVMPAGDAAEYLGELSFAFEGAGALLDNVAVTQETYNNVDFTKLNCYPLTNGDFEAGKVVWGTYNTSYEALNYNTATTEYGAKYGSIKKVISANTYDAMLSQEISLLGGYTYEFSFDAWADSASAMDISMEDGSYTRYFQAVEVEVGTGVTHYSYSFKLASDMDLSLKFMTGGATVADNIYLDNVELKIKGATPRVGTVVLNNNGAYSDGTSVKIGGVDPYLDVFQSSDFSGNFNIYVDGRALTADEYYEVSAGRYGIANSVFTESRVYDIYAGADGYVNSNTVSAAVYPADGNGYCNGTFSAGLDGYGTYVLNGDDYVLTQDGVAALYYSYAGYDEWGNIIPWSIQLASEKVQVTAGTEYTISFYAYSEYERCIRFTINNTDVTTIKIGTAPKVYSFTYTPDTDVLSVMIQAGSVNEDGSYIGTEIYEPHHVYLDNFCAYPSSTGKIASTEGELNDVYAKGGIELPTEPEPEPVVVGQATNVTAAYQNYAVDLNWTAAENAETYTISRAERGGFTVIAEGVTGTAYTDTTAASGTSYTYKITGYNGDTAGTASENVTVSTVIVKKVSGLTASYVDGKVVLNWDDCGAVQYRVLRFTSATNKYTTLTFKAAADGYTDADMIDAELYYYRVCGYFYDENGKLVQGAVSESAAVVATDREPAKVENLTAVIENGTVTLNWDAAEGVRYYKIARADGWSTAEGSYACLKYNVPETSYTDTGLEAGKYRYKVVGYYKNTDGSWVYGPMSSTLFLTVE